jgi:NADPH-dependent curcumin reductase CurA
VFISGAAGVVGSLAGQIAKIKECRVLGSDEKAAHLRQ